METIQLKDPNTPPSDEVLKEVLGTSFDAFDELMKTVRNAPYDLVAGWNYYIDGMAWLCKVQFKKKTVFWLSVWDHYFKTAFYFTEKTKPGVLELEISEPVKTDFIEKKPTGKSIPLVINVTGKEQLGDVLRIVEYKKRLK
ncbi:DUF3788 family protein [Prolixibacter denitrificans]|uniref:Uncharacterized protein DUF3788 n=1 Tax=Prolixibacter denitrificans TaxID=1541063 RepID=A0A2P8C831_9BACT|nr:DUF3788 family protein [Prolixibacter denitrificans]PSK81133.1 uncharacterized protein DUF3788 [Prolixibacter denitrificans]GET22250.1 hypothetical protein JCM18694_24960 [Prolixibacter denitrificans]